MDEIRIKQLEVFAHHGVFPEENRLGQKFVISAALRTHLRTAGLTDDLTQSMDYGAVCAEIQTFLTQHTFRLLETAAEKLREHLLQTRRCSTASNWKLKSRGRRLVCRSRPPLSASNAAGTWHISRLARTSETARDIWTERYRRWSRMKPCAWNACRITS